MLLNAESEVSGLRSCIRTGLLVVREEAMNVEARVSLRQGSRSVRWDHTRRSFFESSIFRGSVVLASLVWPFLA